MKADESHITAVWVNIFLRVIKTWMPVKAIKSKRVITPEGIREAIVVIKGGKIAEVVNKLPAGDFHLIDVNDSVVMAGIVDPHVHINEPGRTDWEGFDTATRAAIAGGITSLVEMPLNSNPVTTTVKAFDEKLKAAKGQLHSHCGFWGGVIPGNEKEIEPLIQKGVMGFKAFLTHSGIEEFPNVKEEDLRKAMPIIAKYKIPLLVHCELENSTGPSHPEMTGEDTRRKYSHYLASRPEKWEEEAIALMIRLCGEFNCPVHIVHLSSAAALGQIKEARQKGLPLTVETAQHYLYFDAAQVPDGGTAFKCAPPIREKNNQESLWNALRDGLIDFVATDHSPAPPELKEIESGDFMKAWGGIASLQFALPILWTGAKHRGHDLYDISRWLCSQPARLPGLQLSKGKIQKGFDADLVIWNPEVRFTVNKEMILHRHKVCPYLHEELSGVVSQTWLNGEQVYAEGKFLHLNKGRLLLQAAETNRNNDRTNLHATD